MDLVNVTHIFPNLSVKKCLSNNIKFEDLTVVYSLTNPIRSKIFNFNQFVSNQHVKAFPQNNTNLPCNCAGSSFLDKDHRNIETGELPIVENNKSRKFFIKSTKKREANNLQWKEATSIIIEELSDCIDT